MPFIEELDTDEISTEKTSMAGADGGGMANLQPTRGAGRAPQSGGTLGGMSSVGGGRSPDMSMMMSMLMSGAGSGAGSSAELEAARRHLAESRSRKEQSAAVPEWDSGVAELLNAIGSTNVFLGTSAALEDGALKEHGIVAVLTVGVCPRQRQGQAMRRHSIKLGDLSSAPMLAQMPRAFDFIDAALEEGSVLVAAEEDDGTETAAAAVVVGWLMARQGVPWAEAPGRVLSDRPSASLNKNFEKQLRVWSRWKEFPGLPEWVIDGF